MFERRETVLAGLQFNAGTWPPNPLHRFAVWALRTIQRLLYYFQMLIITYATNVKHVFQYAMSPLSRLILYILLDLYSFVVLSLSSWPQGDRTSWLGGAGDIIWCLRSHFSSISK